MTFKTWRECDGDYRRDSKGASAGTRSIERGYCGIGAAGGNDYQSANTKRSGWATPNSARSGAKESVARAEGTLGKTAGGEIHERSAWRDERQTNYFNRRSSTDQSGK